MAKSSLGKVQKGNNVWGQLLSVKQSCLQLLALSRVAEMALQRMLDLRKERTLTDVESNILTLSNTILTDVKQFHARFKQIESMHINKNNDGQTIEDYAEAVHIGSLYDQWATEYNGVVSANILAIQRYITEVPMAPQGV